MGPSRSSDREVPHRACVVLTPPGTSTCDKYSSAVPLESPCRPLNDSRCLLVGIEISPLPEVPAACPPPHPPNPLPLYELYFVSYDIPQEPSYRSPTLVGRNRRTRSLVCGRGGAMPLNVLSSYECQNMPSLAGFRQPPSPQCHASFVD